MRSPRPLFRGLICLISGLGLIPAALGAQASYTIGVQQVLDRVYSYTAADVLDVQPASADWSVDTSNLGITAAALSVCALTPVSGLYCVDGAQVRNWPNPADPASNYKLLDCTATLGFDAKAGGCTGLSVSQAGTIWLAGKKKNSFSVVEVKRASGACSGVSFTANGSGYCAIERYTGRPVLVDINVVDGDAAARFPLGTGLIGIEERKNAVFFPDPLGTPVVLASGRDWGLSGGESLQDVALLQVPQTGGGTRSFLLVTTSNGRVLTRSIAGTSAQPALGAVRLVYNIPGERSGSACTNTGTQQYGLRASSTASVVYASDRNYCQILPLQPDSENFNSLQHVQRENGSDLILSTDAGAGFVYPIVGLTVAPGISLRLADCNPRCDVVGDGDDNNTPGAQFIGVSLVPNTPDGAVAFQVKGIPDCRYEAQASFSAEQAAACDLPGVVGGPESCGGASCPTAAQWLNVTPLLPSDVVRAFSASGIGNGVLPPLLISPQYRAQALNGHVFEAFFVITSPQVRFRDTFEMEYDVADLQGSASLGCEATSSALPALLKWDVGTTVSEMYKSVDGQYIDTLRNIGCGSIRDMGERLSLLPYNLEITPDTYAPTLNSLTPQLTIGNDAVFARLMQKLYGDLNYVQVNLACQKADGQAASLGAPLTDSACGSLESSWQNGLVKLNKCIEAGFQPKQSAGDENCQSFVSQLTNYRTRIPATTSASDIANRTGELKARVAVLLHLYYTRYLPSIPSNGFCREAGACSAGL